MYESAVKCALTQVRSKNLRPKTPTASVALSEKHALELRREIRLNKLRGALDISQEELAELLNKKQAAISRLKRRSDMHVSTLQAFVKALGGKLEIIAQFPNASYHIKQFESDEAAGDAVLTESATSLP